MNEVDLPWDAMPPRAVASLFRTYPGRWWIAGGWALDLFLGHPTRLHGDTDVLVLQRDLEHIHTTLPGWIIMVADPPGTLRTWLPGETLPVGVRDIWCRPSGAETWRLQLMVIRAEGNRWFFPRDPRISGNLDDLGDVRERIPILAPQVQLLYKACAPHRPRDEADLRRMIPRLPAERQRWLRQAVELLYPDSPALDLLP